MKKNKSKGFIMKTQIAATPTLYGEDALAVMRELEVRPTEKSRENGRKLVEYFKKMKGVK